MKTHFLLGCASLLLFGPGRAETILIEAEQFADKGGWGVDTQFIESMGSPYLIAHGLGQPVADASTKVQIEKPGTYRVWVRSLDWTKRLGRASGAGAFELLVNGKKSGDTLGVGPDVWTWQPAGEAALSTGETTIALRDLTGFNGRVDAILLSSDPTFAPPAENHIADRAQWKFRGAPGNGETLEGFDLVVIGGGYGGLGAAISAARMGAKVALIQNREVLGGNGSSEIRVWAKGNLPPSQYPLADIIREIQDEAKASPAPAEEFVDDKKEQVVRAEKNITLLLGHHAYGLEMDNGKIAGVKVLEIGTGKIKRINGRFFADCTGHGFIGQWAGADLTMTDKGRMGMSNMWMWENTDGPVAFAEQPWMLAFESKSFPYPKRGHAEWFWESGFDKHPIKELEITRDWNLVSAFSAWNAIKNRKAHAERDPNGHANAKLSWLAYVGGTRETQQLLGDIILTGDEIVAKKEFPDAVVHTTWSIDLHYPQEEYVHALPEHPFIARADHGKGVDRSSGYPIPYRCFYSRNVPNLFMAGRNISVDRRALGTIRVMKTIGMMGITVGRAAALATARDCTPREVYEKHLDEIKTLWRMPGNQRFNNLDELRDALGAQKP
ncbi:MAG: FAD-dependent oxidoreductase [Verrucomicrobiales bacterium]